MNRYVRDYKSLVRIPMAKLKAVFAPREIEALFSKVKGEPTTRQYIYRARKKFPEFQEIFGIILDI